MRRITLGLVLAGAPLGILAVVFGRNGVISWEAELVPTLLALFLGVCAVCYVVVVSSWPHVSGIVALLLGGAVLLAAPSEMLSPDCACPPHALVPPLAIVGMVWVGCGMVAAIVRVVRGRSPARRS